MEIWGEHEFWGTLIPDREMEIEALITLINIMGTVRGSESAFWTITLRFL